MNKHESPTVTPRLRALALATTLLLGGCGETADNAQADVSKYLRNGETFLEQHQFRAAIIEATNAIQQAPDNRQGHILLARVHNRLGRPKQAIAQLEGIPGGDSVDYYFTLADAYAARGKYRSALDMLEQRRSLMQQRALDYGVLQARSIAGLGQLSKATEHFQTLLEQFPDSADARLGLARLAQQQGEDTAAHQLIAQVLEQHPQHVDALLLKGQLHFNQKQLEQAESFYSQALANAPSTDLFTSRRANILSGLSEILTRQGRSADAMIYSRILANAFPGTQEINSLYQQAQTAFRQGDFHQAESLLTSILAQAPGHDASATLLGVVRYLLGDVEGANRQLADTLDPEIATPMTKQIFAMSQLRLNRPDDVLALLEDDITTTDNPQLLALYGIAALAKGHDDKGVMIMERAIALAPNNLNLHLVLVRHFNSLHPANPRKALGLLTQLAQRIPADAKLQTALLQQYTGMKLPEQANQYLDSVKRRFQDAPSTWLLAGFFTASQGNHSVAASYFDKAVAMAPDRLEGYWGQARSAIQLKDWDTAHQAYQQILDRAPDHVAAYQGVLQLYRLQNKQAEGLKKLSSLASQSTSEAPALALSQYFASQQDFARSAQYLDQAIDKSPQSRQAQYLAMTLEINRVQQLKADGDYEEARRVLNRAMTTSPKEPQLLGLLAEVEIKARRAIEAKAAINKIRQLYPSMSLAELLEGDLALSLGDQESALAHFKSAWLQKQTDTAAMRLFALYRQQPTREQSDVFLSEWIERLPASLPARMNIAARTMEKGHNTEAISQYQQIIRQKPDSVIALNNLAWLYFSEKDPRATETAARAYELGNNNSSVADTYGWILFHQGQIKQAVELLEKASRLSPDNQIIKTHLAQARQRL